MEFPRRKSLDEQIQEAQQESNSNIREQIIETKNSAIMLYHHKASNLNETPNSEALVSKGDVSIDLSGDIAQGKYIEKKRHLNPFDELQQLPAYSQRKRRAIPKKDKEKTKKDTKTNWNDFTAKAVKRSAMGPVNPRDPISP